MKKLFYLSLAVLFLTGINELYAQDQTIKGKLYAKGRVQVQGSGNQILHLRPNAGGGSYVYWAEHGVAERGILGYAAGSGDLVYRAAAYNFENGAERFRINKNGNVGIGTSSPTEKLHVNGKIRATAAVWSDFVFHDNYELPTLTEVENHIREKGHLRDIPSEKEVLENGIDLTEMDAKLLLKIEELTLYIIEQNKRIKALEAKVKSQ